LKHRFAKKLDLIDWSKMSPSKHDVESEGSKPRDHVHTVKHTWCPHKDWRVWVAVVLMLVLVLVYVVTDFRVHAVNVPSPGAVDGQDIPCCELLSGTEQVFPHPRLELLLPPCTAQVLRFPRNGKSVAPKG
jgi:hypothetical protein